MVSSITANNNYSVYSLIKNYNNTISETTNLSKVNISSASNEIIKDDTNSINKRDYELDISSAFSLLTGMAIRNPGVVDIFHQEKLICSNLTDKIVEKFNQDCQEIPKYLGNESKCIEIYANATKNLLNSIEGLEDKERYCQGIDIYVKQRAYEINVDPSFDSNKWISAYSDLCQKNNKLSCKDIMLTFENMIEQWSENYLKEQSNLGDSFISTKMAQC